MKNYKIILLLSVISIFINNDLYSQISKGGIPHSFNLSIENKIETIKMPTINIDSLLQVDNISNEKPFRFGVAIDVDLGLKNNGTWDTLQNGDKIWRLKIQSQNAFSINLIYDDFWLPYGSELFIYNENKSMIYGAFTPELSNNQYNKFATDLIKGETTILEYFEPSYANGARININKVIHGYKNMFKSGHDESGSCNDDVTCSQGDSWCVEKRAVSMILLDNNTRLCSGCLINNLRKDLTPYYLTANHCLNGDENTWIFRFKYWSPTCNQGDDADDWVSILGSTLRANDPNSDFALLELSSRPPSGFGVLYAGWDRTTNPTQSSTAIHHPSGDVMKISFDNNQAVSSDYDPDPIAPNSHWKVVWDQGTTEGGSSGSPLFNQSHRIVGQLHGGTASCSNPNEPDFYGRFDVSWNGGGTAQTRLRDWLDPDNTGAMTVGATSPTIFLINKTLTGTHKFAAVEDIHIEGNVATVGLFCEPSNIPFTTETGSNINIKARTINIKQGTYYKSGSDVTIKAVNNINCNDNLVEGDYVNIFCNAQVSMMLSNSYNNNYNKIIPEQNQNNATPSNKSNQTLNSDIISNVKPEFIIIPNPNNGTFTLQFNKNLNQFKVNIFDLSGKMVYSNNNQLNLTTIGLQKGVYVVVVVTETEILKQKLIIQ